MSRRVVVAGLLALVAGCDPGLVLEGTLREPSGSPVAGAEVAIRCDGQVALAARTDRAGRFRARGTGWRPAACVVDVTDAGGARRGSWPIMTVCSKRRGADACLAVTGERRLPDLPAR